jgi:peptidyl-prolyl cis-trans isomerase SurA
LKKIPVPVSYSAEVQESFLNQIEMNDRIRIVKTQQYQNILKYVSISQPEYDITDIRLYTDSILNYISPGGELKIKGSSVLFELSDKKKELRKPITAADWIGFAQVFRYKSDGTGTKDYVTLWKEFTEAQVASFYETNLEYFNEEFRNQLHEFRDGNLFFEVMQQNVWGPAQTDTAALRDYYENNKAKYLWKPGADAVIFFASDAASSRSFLNALNKSPRKWPELVNENSENISADSARFELEQIPRGKNQVLRKGMITSPVTNTKDKTVSFAYIVNLHTQTEPRNFTDAKGLVISDFQEDIEKRWVEELKRKYVVKINQAELDRLVREKRWM